MGKKGKSTVHHCPKAKKGNCKEVKNPYVNDDKGCKTHQVLCPICKYSRLPNEGCRYERRHRKEGKGSDEQPLEPIRGSIRGRLDSTNNPTL